MEKSNVLSTLWKSVDVFNILHACPVLPSAFKVKLCHMSTDMKQGYIELKSIPLPHNS